MTTTTTTWRDIPANNLIRLLRDDGVHPREIISPEVIADLYTIPLELLPVKEILSDEMPGISFFNKGKPAAYIQGVVGGDLIDAIAAGLGVKRPADARPGYSGGRFDLAAAIVKHLKTA